MFANRKLAVSIIFFFLPKMALKHIFTASATGPVGQHQQRPPWGFERWRHSASHIVPGGGGISQALLLQAEPKSAGSKGR